MIAIIVRCITRIRCFLFADVINTSVLWLATKFFKNKSPLVPESASNKAIAMAMYQPNIAQTKLKNIFRCFSR